MTTVLLICLGMMQVGSLHKELENKQTEAGMIFELIVQNGLYFYSCNVSLIDVIW